VDSDGLPEEDQETILRREREHAEYLKEEKEYRRKMLLESISKKPKEMIEDLKLKLKEVTEDIEHYEQLSDDEFDLYENNLITNAYANAKSRVH
jgi:TRAP-type C4-dicarboxylate transport system substrate-binding protein